MPPEDWGSACRPRELGGRELAVARAAADGRASRWRTRPRPHGGSLGPAGRGSPDRGQRDPDPRPVRAEHGAFAIFWPALDSLTRRSIFGCQKATLAPVRGVETTLRASLGPLARAEQHLAAQPLGPDPWDRADVANLDVGSQSG